MKEDWVMGTNEGVCCGGCCCMESGGEGAGSGCWEECIEVG